jgi:hypothetical protein
VIQHGSGVVDGPTLDAGQSAATQRAPNPSKGGIKEEFKDIDKLRHAFTLDDPLEEIDIGDGKTLRPTFVNKTM